LIDLRTEAALAAALLVSGCAGDGALRREVESLRAEVAAARQESRELARTVEGLSSRMEAVTARLTRGQGDARPAEPRALELRQSDVRAAEPRAAAPQATVVPGGLAVVRVEPPGSGRAPPVATAVPIVEPDPGRLQALTRRSGRELAAEAEAELRAARKATGFVRAHALEDFVSRYPHHPQAAAALLEAGEAYADAGRPDAACSLSRRAASEYPAGDAASEALWRVAACESRAGAAEGERKTLLRLTSEFPATPAARRAGERLATISGRAGVSPADGPARSSP
jgi:TolA-binding protein